MKLYHTLGGAMIAVSLLAAPAVFAAETAKKANMHEVMANPHQFMQACDMNHDDMMTKAEMLAHMEKMFDRVDVKKTGKLDKVQTAEFLRKLTAGGN